jgi:hypothetical protein
MLYKTNAYFVTFSVMLSKCESYHQRRTDTDARISALQQSVDTAQSHGNTAREKAAKIKVCVLLCAKIVRLYICVYIGYSTSPCYTEWNGYVI